MTEECKPRLVRDKFRRFIRPVGAFSMVVLFICIDLFFLPMLPTAIGNQLPGLLIFVISASVIGLAVWLVRIGDG